MSKILSRLVLDPLDKRKWALEYDFIYESDLAGRLIVPAGFVCDLNSIPRFLWWASTPTDFPEAGVVHDWAYRGNLPRNVADRVYAELLTLLGMGDARVASRYMALRAFGRWAYNKRGKK